MYIGKTLCAQLMEFMPWTSFTRIVARYGGDKGATGISGWRWQQYLFAVRANSTATRSLASSTMISCLSGCHPHPLDVGCFHSPE